MILKFPEFKVVDKYREIIKNIFIVDIKISKFNNFYDRTIFSKCHSSDGFKLSKNKQKMILSFLNEPTVEKWDLIYKFQIIPDKTLWDAWNISLKNNKISAINSNSILSEKWKNIPKQSELIKGIITLVNHEEEKLIDIKSKLEFELQIIEGKYKNFIKKYA